MDAGGFFTFYRFYHFYHFYHGGGWSDKNDKKRKTENGKRRTDDKPRAEGACTLCRGAKEEKPAKQD